MSDTAPSGDTTRIIPPPRRGPRWIDLALAAVAGALLTVLVIGLFVLGRPGVAPATSGSASPSASASALPSIRSATVAPSTEAPTTAPPAPSSPPATATPPRTGPPTTAPPTTAAPTTPAPTKTP